MKTLESKEQPDEAHLKPGQKKPVMPNLDGFEDVTIVEKVSPYTRDLFEAFDGSLPYDEIVK